MRCFYPITLKESQLIVPCGNCPACKMKRRSDWTLRLLYENKRAEQSYFVTMTYNDGHLPYNGNLDKHGLIKYMKRLRSENPKLKYYSIGEYGTRYLRPHYHAIIFNADPLSIIDKWREPLMIGDDVINPRDEIGDVQLDEVNNGTIHYVTKYISDPKNHEVIEINPITGRKKYGNRLIAELGNEQPFSIMSKGIGENYIDEMKSYHLKNLTRFTRINEHRLSLPRYLQDKIFDSCKDILLEEENEKLRIRNEEQLMKESMTRRQEVRHYYNVINDRNSKSKKV